MNKPNYIGERINEYTENVWRSVPLVRDKLFETVPRARTEMICALDLALEIKIANILYYGVVPSFFLGKDFKAVEKGEIE